MNPIIEMIKRLRGETGHSRQTRSGGVRSKFNITHEFLVRQNRLPIVTGKKVHINLIIGELLWFLSGKTDLESLRKFSGISEDAWTIWTNDAERWGGKGNTSCGKIYGHNWRNFGGTLGVPNTGVDQITKLIRGIITDPYSRYHRVTAWNPLDMHNKELCLPACHTDFQCYITKEGKLNLHWNQRSCDVFLGVPYNITSYAVLLLVLSKLTGRLPDKLSCWLGDYHVYDNHLEATVKYLNNGCHIFPSIELPEFDTLEGLLQYTAEDFKLINYNHGGVIKAPLSVG